MLLAIAGVSGIGKSYYKDLIASELNFEKIKILTTREPRKGMKIADDKPTITEDELKQMEKDGKVGYKFTWLGNTYVYTKDALFSVKNTVFDLHYETIYDFKKICPNLKTIYLLPANIEEAKLKVKERNLKPEVEKCRIEDIEKHYNLYKTDENFRNMFDYVLYNKYDKESEEKVINLVREMLKSEGDML